ncbi:hypothetical protein M3194_05940 [Paenibacillus glycanilyticus]|uniref:hypothetical protein n=1 Tax=Paenibacillus glycanilyticus TaxID=126569 RepID=UPI0020422C7B|nr:hypothetical protein [Paenibacillus glycanilyticus]MCM3626900.1 hypothetical protein [Paenibacillus glycanilyticus]
MYKLACMLLLLAFVLVGCSHSTSLMKEVGQQKLNHDVSMFVERNKSKNGIYLYSATGMNEYLIVNYSTAEQGEKVKLLAGMHAEIQNDVLAILMDVSETSDLKDDRIKPISIYKINKHDRADAIKVFINGQETPIDIVGS